MNWSLGHYHFCTNNWADCNSDLPNLSPHIGSYAVIAHFYCTSLNKVRTSGYLHLFSNMFQQNYFSRSSEISTSIWSKSISIDIQFANCMRAPVCRIIPRNHDTSTTNKLNQYRIRNEIQRPSIRCCVINSMNVVVVLDRFWIRPITPIPSRSIMLPIFIKQWHFNFQSKKYNYFFTFNL